MATWDVDLLVAVRVVVENPDVIARCVNNEDGWRERFYDLDSEEKVLEHLAYNATVNGRDNLRGLDGWADLPPDSARMSVTDVDLETTWEVDG